MKRIKIPIVLVVVVALLAAGGLILEFTTYSNNLREHQSLNKPIEPLFVSETHTARGLSAWVNIPKEMQLAIQNHSGEMRQLDRAVFVKPCLVAEEHRSDSPPTVGHVSYSTRYSVAGDLHWGVRAERGHWIGDRFVCSVYVDIAKPTYRFELTIQATWTGEPPPWPIEVSWNGPFLAHPDRR